MTDTLYRQLEQFGHKSVFDILALGREEFLSRATKLYSSSEAEMLYEAALSRASMVTRRYLEALGQPPGILSPVSVNTSGEQPIWDDIFPEDTSALCPPDSLEANDSPAAYLNQLYRLALKLEKSQENNDYLLKKRRPDLPELSVDAENWKTELPTQQIVDEILARGLASAARQDAPSVPVPEKLSLTRYPMQLPYDAPTDTIQRSLMVYDSDQGLLLLQNADEPAFLVETHNNTVLRSAQRSTLNMAPELRRLCGEKPVFYAGTIVPETSQSESLIGPDITCLLPWQVLNTDTYCCGLVTLPAIDGDAGAAEATPPADALVVSAEVNKNTSLTVPCFRVAGSGPLLLTVEVGACCIQPDGTTDTNGDPIDMQTHINNAVTGKRKPSRRYLKLWFTRITHPDTPDQNYIPEPDDAYAGTLRLQAKSYADQRIIGEFVYSVQFQGNDGDITQQDAKDYCITHYGRPLLDTIRTGAEVRLPLNDVLSSCKLSCAELETLLCQNELAPRISPNCQPTNSMFGLGRSTHGFPAPYHYGAVYLHGGAEPLLHIEEESEQPQLHGSAIVIERLHRFIRLQKVLSLDHEELDRFIFACSVADRNNHGYSMVLDDNIFRALGLFQQWNRRYKVDALTFAAILYQISPFSLGNAETQLDRLFNHDCPEKDRLILDWQPQEDDFSTGDLHPWSKRLCAGLRINESDYRMLAPLVLEYQPLPEVNTQARRLYRTLDTLSTFHRIVCVFRLLGFSPQEGIALVNLLEESELIWKQLAGQPTLADTDGTIDILDSLMRLEALATWLHSQSLQPSTAYLLLKRDGMAVIPTDTLMNWLKGIASQVKTSVVDDSRLQTLGLPPTETNNAEINWLSVLAPLLSGEGLLQSHIEKEEDLSAQLSSALANLELRDKVSIHQKLLSLLSSNLLQQRNAAQNAISSQYQVSAQIPEQLLRWVNSNENALLEIALKSQTGEALTGSDLEWLYNLGTYAAIVNHLNLSPVVLNSLVENPTYWEEQGNRVPVSLNLKNFHRLCAFAELRDSVENGEALALQWLQKVNSPGEDSQQLLQQLFGLNADDASYAIKTPPGNIGQMTALKRKQSACKKMGLSLSALDHVIKSMTRDTSFTSRQKMADTLLNAVRANTQEK